MRLSLIARSHDVSNLHGERYTGTSKAEVTYRCLFSLVESLNYALRQDGILTEAKPQFTLTIIDDHSNNSELIQKILARVQCKTSFTELQGKGNNDSLLKAFTLGREAEELVYFVEDDYLHERTAIEEMIYD